MTYIVLKAPLNSNQPTNQPASVDDNFQYRTRVILGVNGIDKLVYIEGAILDHIAIYRSVPFLDIPGA